MIETLLRRAALHPKRVWIVTILTLVVILVFGWPAVDSYIAAREHRADLERTLQEGASVLGRLELYQREADKKLAQIRALESKVLIAAEVDALRNQLVAMVKESGCRLRRVRLGEATERTWYDEDSPLEARPRPESDRKSPFKLKMQPLNLAVTGNLTKVSEFLARLSEQDKLIHTAAFQMRRSTEDQSMVELELDLLLFDLVPTGPKKA